MENSLKYFLREYNKTVLAVSGMRDYTQLACGFDSNICMWQDAKRWMHAHGGPNSTVPKGGYLRYSQFNEINGDAFLLSPIVNNTENSYCFLVQYQILGEADLQLYMDDDLVLSLLRNNSDSSGLWHLERVNITNLNDGFQLYLYVDDRSPDNVTVSVDYTDLRSGPCDSSMMMEDVPSYLSDISVPDLSGGLGGNLHPDGGDLSAPHSNDEIPLPLTIGVPEPSTFGVENDGRLPATGLILPDSLLPEFGSEDIAQPPSLLTKPVVDNGSRDIPAIASLPAVEGFRGNLQPVGENLALTLPPHSGPTRL
ncbi:uncharacterized protein LOC134271298 [Saccostrea cucullata]|uniref:uncharacterized protein LOC134271298 n=1 Tax=Saccostrea cuccullata TaxID=36930 RepID=UPI002ED26A35